MQPVDSHAFRRFRNTHLRNRTAGWPEGLQKFWMVHADESMSDLYDIIKEDVEFRREWAEKCGFGFKLPSVVPNVPKTEEKIRGAKSRVSIFKLCEKEWSALVDNFRTYLAFSRKAIDISVETAEPHCEREPKETVADCAER